MTRQGGMPDVVDESLCLQVGPVDLADLERERFTQRQTLMVLPDF